MSTLTLPASSETALANRRILVVEDEPDIAALLKLHLGELAEVTTADNGLSGLEAAQQGDWDAIVLDLRLPGMGGLDVCRELRQSGDTVPILMLTARATELDRVLGLELGADDYLTKPFGVLELQARIRALWRRSASTASQAQAASAPGLPAEETEVVLSRLRLNRMQRRAWLNEAELTLTPREFDLLWFFAKQPGRAFSRAELLSAVWGYGHDGYDHTVNTHINRLRNKLGEDSWINTVWGVGYRFEVVA
ncbi:response regulator transcription factor [Ideonella paludis]|uniref:Response regulator transcription factor n=1 Tax=Ideonella paludis TaxID=1233411 RepID=A0ABS5DY23_9BURK|nr:response regulator transcription factor [Ideonella paludis]MBQ0936048.1 response regulator transcription factor [Ideonella paludis]